MAWKSSSKKSRAKNVEALAVERLGLVRQRREPFATLMKRLVHETLAEFLPPEGNVLEIGAGDGQLYRYLPESLHARLLHSEPSAAASRAFRQQHPDARVLQAPAERLPLADGSLAAVLGLCVLDVVDDGPAVAAELARVLRPGGVLIHFLDMSTRLNALVDDLARSSWVPLPNVFSDPSDSPWPEDLFVAPLAELALVADVLLRHQHPFGQPLTRYLNAARQGGAVAAAELAQLQESAPLRVALREMFRDAFQVAEPELRPRLAGFQGRPLSSARHFSKRMEDWFKPPCHLEIEQLVVRSVAEVVAKRPDEAAYMSANVGEQRTLADPPHVSICATAEMPKENQALHELGVLVLVTRKQRQLGPQK